MDELIPIKLNTGEKCGFSAGELGETLLAEYAGDKTMLANIASAMDRDLQDFVPSLLVHDGHIAIVGSGPSVNQFVDAIRSEKELGRPIMAIKGAHDWLIKHGILPDCAVTMDSQAHTWEGFSLKHPQICYLIASKAHPATFDHLLDVQVIRWHAWGNPEANALYPKKAYLVGGGSTSGLRGITLAWLMGFRKVTLYGFDSCLTGRAMRADGSLNQQWMLPMKAGKDGAWRMCDAALASQAAEFQAMTFDILDGIKIKVIGDGLIADIMADRKALGANDDF